MFNKYEIKTYPEYYNQENSESDNENEMLNMPFKKADFNNDIKINKNGKDNSCIFIENYDNIVFYQSDAKNRFKERKIKNNKIQKNIKSMINYDSDIINRKTAPSPIFPKKKYVVKLAKIEESKENLSQRKNLNKYFNLNDEKIVKNTFKQYTNDLDVQKSDNFNVLSYKQEEDYYTDNPKPEKKNKIIQIFKKQEVSELFLPSKRTVSPPSPPLSKTNTDKKKKIRDNSSSCYQTPTLKFQSFFGSFMRPKLNKKNQNKSTSKSKINQLQDFNIDKLIEIGDNTENNKYKNILSFGKRLKRIKEQNRINKYKNGINPVHLGEYYKCKTENDNDEDEYQKYTPIQRIELDRKDYNDVKIKKIENKKILYHGQIKRKRNIKKNKTLYNGNKKIKINDTSNTNNTNDNQNKSLDKNQDIISNNKLNNSTNFSNKINSYTSKINERVINNNPQNNNINNNINKIIINKRNNNNSIINQLSPKNNKASNAKFHYLVKNMYNTDNIIEKNKAHNHISINREKITNKDLYKKNILSEIKEIEYNESNSNDSIEEEKNNKSNIKKGSVTDEEKIIKKQGINSHQIKDIKKSYQKEFKTKRYYGYDDRHNLEGTINNHSFRVSVYSAKANKVN